MKIYILLIAALFILISASCSKKNDGNNSGNNSSQNSVEENSDKKDGNNNLSQSQQNEIVYLGKWDGKRVIVEDNYRFSANENIKDTTGAGYDNYCQSLKDIINKYQKLNDLKYEYFFDDFKPEFEKYTGFKKGDKINVSANNGVYSAEIAGYYINMDDIIGGGIVFYAYVNAPAGAKFEENEVMVCSQNNHLKKMNNKSVTNQQVLDKFKEYLLPKLKGINSARFDDKGEQISGPVTKLTNEEIKLFEGSFTAAGKNEFLVGVKLQNDFTNFTSLIYIMDEDGKIISEHSPLAVNNFTFGSVDAVVDINGDGILEIMTYDGYYEGGTYNLWKYNGGLFKVITSGFSFGV